MNKKPVIGLIGGGQLARMFMEEALRYNVTCAVLDDDTHSPSASLAAIFHSGSIRDSNALNDFAKKCDVLTYEIEHVNTEALIELEKNGKVIFPYPRVLEIIQDKGLQKTFYSNNNIPTADFVLVNNKSEWKETIRKKGWKKFVAKSCKDGYDGKGVKIMTSLEIENESNIPFLNQTVLEEFIPNAKEVSIIVARAQDGSMNVFPTAEMVFDMEANLVSYLFAPAILSSDIEKKLHDAAIKVVSAFNSPGLYAVEMMITNDTVLVNETAPRPHNSGHHTIEACYTSQYEQLLRILLNYPLGSTQLIQPAAMINILGDVGFTGEYYLANENEILAIEGVYLHLYGKKISKSKRKLGHITVLANNTNELSEKVKRLMNLISIKQAL